MSLAKFKHPENGFLLNNTCIIEAQIQELGLVKQD
ncbi:MATH/TRAF domain containing protein [Parasponia andersonii]|uniref:MATH/TRAF domain containing protein n=1 Tax=Parasponia andersonii TaxID=3476 RepID=A0A2P5A8I3_PARAD|nr:MATH/TRAF domain containing protein [Parasponia andersonii]